MPLRPILLSHPQHPLQFDCLLFTLKSSACLFAYLIFPHFFHNIHISEQLATGCNCSNVASRRAKWCIVNVFILWLLFNEQETHWMCWMRIKSWVEKRVQSICVVVFVLLLLLFLHPVCTAYLHSFVPYNSCIAFNQLIIPLLLLLLVYLPRSII